MYRGIWLQAACVLTFAGAAPTLAQEDAARLSAHLEHERRLVAEANQASVNALELRMKGELAGSISHYRKAVQAYEAIVVSCGKVVGTVVLGCAYDEHTLGSAVGDLAGALHDQGDTEEGVEAFEAALARQELRWQGCGSAAWNFTCAQAAEKRRSFLYHHARFLEMAGRFEETLKLRWQVLSELEALLAACGEACDDATDDALSAYSALRETLAKAGRTGDAAALDDTWLPRLVASPLYGRGKAADADYSASNYAAALDAIVSEVAARNTPQSAALLVRLGRGEALAAHAAEAEYASRMAALQDSFGRLYRGDYAKRAANLAEQARIIAAHHGENVREHGMALITLAREHEFGNQWGAAADAWRQALTIHRSNEPADDFRVVSAAEGLALALEESGRPQEAIAALAEVLAHPANDKMALYSDPVRSASLAYGVGDSFRNLNGAHALLGRMILEHGGDPERALAAARHASTGVTAYRRSLSDQFEDEENRERAERDPEWYTGEPRFGAFAVLFADALWSAERRDAGGRGEAFALLQEATGGTTTSALARNAAVRIASLRGAGPLLRRREALTAEISRGMRALLQEPASQQARTDDFNELARLREDRAQVDLQIAAAAPDFFALTRPRPLDLAQTQALLGPDEAALIAVPSRFGTHTLLVTREQLAWRRAPLPEASLNERVRRLLWDVGGNVEVSNEEEAAWAAEGEGVFPFDRGTAHLLYRELVQPLDSLLEGKRHLFVIGGGALASLPFSLLVVDPPQGRDGDPEALRETAWFGDRIGLIQLPSLQSLQLLRLVAERGAAASGEGLVAYGDPVLLGAAATRGISNARDRTRSAALPPGAPLETSDGLPLADVSRLRSLARLPGTADELTAMQSEFGVESVRLRTGSEATEARLKGDDLRNLSVLAFATHGLLAGEARDFGGSEPGLVLTPPSRASALDDGLLTASEIAGLTIDAEWVVLSACNTAAGDGSSGATGLSGLARSFFFAGARSLLASHWPVRDDVAAVLTVEVLRQQRAHPRWSRAEALRAAMKAIRDDDRVDHQDDTWAHPSAWAPFTFVGDWR